MSTPRPTTILLELTPLEASAVRRAIAHAYNGPVSCVHDRLQKLIVANREEYRQSQNERFQDGLGRLLSGLPEGD